MSLTNIFEINNIRGNNIKYVPINLNTMIHQKCYNILSFINTKIINSITDELLKIADNTDLLLFDFANTNTNTSEIFSELFNKDICKFKIILANIQNLPMHKNVVTILEGQRILYTNQNSKNVHHICINNNIDDVNEVLSECNCFITDQLKDICFSGQNNNSNHYLSNSNLYIKDYFNAKNIFSNSVLFAYTINKMCEVINNNYVDVDGLICTSNNGAILCNVIGDMVNKKPLFAFNIGPNLSIKDIEDLDKIEKNKKYIYIFDFMCIGTEYKIIQTIIRMKKASIIASVGVGYYLKPDRNKELDNFYGLINLKPEEYKASFFKEELSI